jgi:hypothetical protein
MRQGRPVGPAAIRRGSFCDVRIEASADEVAGSLQGHWRAEHLFALEQALTGFDFCGTQLAECDAELSDQAGSGLRGMRGIASFIRTHGCAESHQMLTCGSSHDVSSNAPALTQSVVGIAATFENIGDPHLEQNRRNTGRPLSPTSW